MSQVTSPARLEPAPAPLRVFISAAEPSGDLHAADLIAQMREMAPQTRFFGVAGPRMQAAGCEAMDDLTERSAMLLGAVGLAGRAWQLIRRIGRRIAATPPDLAILVDSPALHLPMARVIRRARVPILYYIAPQLWAWAPWRIGRVRRRVDHLAVILPFEETYFRQRGVEATFVGHPLVEQLRSRTLNPERIGALRQSGTPVVACLPGSRRHVVQEVLPGQIEVARAIARRHPGAAFLFAAANPNAAQAIQDGLHGSGLNARIETGSNGEILSAADLALCASGTATLEVAWYGVPMVVMYNGSKWGYQLAGRFLIQTPHLSLVNILASRRIVPEFMPYYTSTEPIAAEALDLLANAPRRDQMKRDLTQVIASLGDSCAAAKAARIALQLADVRA